jgi:hypothetical protein
LLILLNWSTPPLGEIGHFLQITQLGFIHILGSQDHLLFLFTVVMVGARFWSLIAVVTAAALAHALAQGLAWYGVMDLPHRLSESLIALAILHVAVENLRGRGMKDRWMPAAGFGLLHGLGYYRASSDLGLDSPDIASALLAFNIGFGAGQVVFVVLVFLPQAWWVRQDWHGLSVKLVSAGIVVISAWWLADRAMLI